MSILYPVPRPVTTKVVARPPLPYMDETFMLPAAPPPPVELPSLIMAPIAPPQGWRL